MTETTRQPAVAGTFYPGAAATLEREVKSLLGPVEAEHDLLGCIAPHAGYMYSGTVAAQLFGHLRLPRRLVVLGPNHTGAGAPVAVAPHEQWQTPLGPVQVDGELAELLVEEWPSAELDHRAHRREHSIEVQIPFLQVRRPELTVLPVCLQHLGLAPCLDLGAALARLADRCGEPVGFIASSDMSHYEPDASARERDRLAIDQVLALDPEALYETVHRHAISMCGVVPATVVLEASRRLGATAAHLVAYSTSGDTTGDLSAVVGYAGICIHR